MQKVAHSQVTKLCCLIKELSSMEQLHKNSRMLNRAIVKCLILLTVFLTKDDIAPFTKF